MCLYTRQKINNILNDNEKSMKSKASSIAWIYRKQGMDQSEAMKKAWSEIERKSQSSSEKIKEDIHSIGLQADNTSEMLSENLAPALNEIAVVFAAAFSIKGIIDFGAQCIELGSDLAEVQNVVDVTFPAMSKQIDNFAKNAITQFGLSETMAKRYAGTFGAMAKAFGFNEKAAYDMSTTLTGLAGDVASFYNISQDEAYIKLKSVFTGETESIKDLGTVMTQAALDSYALANGFGKTTAKMSEAEKVALRYKFVQEQLSLAAGDFSRTSDGWANQIRVLQLQFDSLKATIGQGLINVLTPVIKVINLVISKLMSLANAFKSFTELITGKKSGGGVSAAATGMEDIAGSADNAGAAMGGAGSDAKKAAKDIKGAMSGIDELNVIQAPDSSGSGGRAGGGYAADEFDMGEVNTSAVDEMDSKYQGLIDKARELSSLFKGGFNIAFGNTGVLDSIQQSISNIGQSLKDIFLNPAVASAADEFLNRFVFNLGKVSGSMASTGASIADNLLGGISLFLEQNKERLIEYIVTMFDISSRISEISGRFSTAVATIFESFRSGSAKQITSDIIGIFSEGFMGVTKLAGTFVVDLLDVLTGPIIDNADYIKSTLEDTFSAVEPVFATIKESVEETFSKIGTAYNEHVAPMLMSFKEGFTEITTKLLDSYNQYILPVLENLSKKFDTVWKSSIQPMLDGLIDLFGKVAELVKSVWEETLQPFFSGIAEEFGPLVAPVIQGIGESFLNAFAGLADLITPILEKLGDFADWCGNNQGTVIGITGAIGGFGLALKGIEFASSIQQAGGLSQALSNMKGSIDTVKNAFMACTVEKIKDKVETLALNAMYAKDFVASLATGTAELVKQAAQFALNTAAKAADAAAQAVMTAATVAWNAVCTVATTLTTALGAAIAFLTSPIGLVVLAITGLVAAGVFLYKHWDTVKEYAIQIWALIKDTISGAIEAVKTFVSEKLEAIKETWERIWGGIKQFASSVWDGIKNVVSTAINAVKAVLETIMDVITAYWEFKWNVIKTFITVLWTAIKTLAETVFPAIRDKLSEIWESIKQTVEEKWNTIKTWVQDTWNGIHEKAKEVFQGLRDTLAELWDEVKGTVEEKWNAIREWFAEIWQKIKDIFNPEEMLEVGKSFMNKLFDGMKAVWGDIKDWLSEIGEAIGNAFDTVVSGVKNMFKKGKEEAEEELEESKSSKSSKKSSSGGGPKLTSESSPATGPGKALGFATGGFPEDGWFRASHGEILGQFDNGKSVVANNMQITEGISRAVQSGMRGSMAPVIASMQAMTRQAAPNLAMVGSSFGEDDRQARRMEEMATQAMELASNHNLNESYLAIMVDLLKRIIDLIESMDLTVNIDIREIRKKLVELEKRTGYTLRTT